MNTVAAHAEIDDLFDHFNVSCQQHFAEVAGERTPLFTVATDADLYSTYLDSFEEATGDRQHHNCHCCRQFIQRYGNLVVIDETTGELKSAIWNPETAPELYKHAAAAMERAVLGGKVDGVFLSKDKVWGTPVTGQWTHFAIRPHASHLHRDRLMTPYQAMAQKKQDFGTLSHGLGEFNRDVVGQAVSLLSSEALYRSEKVLGPARFLLELHDKLGCQPRKNVRRNLIWRAVATAPVGFATPRSSMVGTLLLDIALGMPFETVQRRFAEKMNPLQYQRPQAPASAGNIEQAEKIVAKLGIQNSLKRRFARLDEMQLLWSPKPKEEPAKAGGVFGHLRSRRPDPEPILAKGAAITWVKFASTVLPKAERIQVRMDFTMNFCGILTAVDMDAPPILQWDQEDDRNPVSWYVYNGGSQASRWGLVAGRWVDATGAMLKPSMWAGDNRYSHLGNGAVLILDGARDTENKSLALFPECLKSELHSIRSTIEAFSRSSEAEGAEEGSANGVFIGDRGNDVTVRVTTALGLTEYRIDRWD